MPDKPHYIFIEHHLTDLLDLISMNFCLLFRILAPDLIHPSSWLQMRALLQDQPYRRDS